MLNIVLREIYSGDINTGLSVNLFQMLPAEETVNININISDAQVWQRWEL